MLWIPIPEKPVDPVATMFKHLETFMINMLEVDALHSVPHNLSKYKLMEEMPEPRDDLDLLPDNVNKWLTYFPQAQPWAQGGYTCTLVLLGFREPFPKIIKVTTSWLHKTKFGLWKSSLQLEKPVALGWLLFSTFTMGVEVLWGEISLRILSMPVGLHWKMISMGAQGSIPQEQCTPLICQCVGCSISQTAAHESLYK